VINCIQKCYIGCIQCGKPKYIKRIAEAIQRLFFSYNNDK